MAKKQKGGINIAKSRLEARDIIGRDRVDITTLDQDEKNGWLLFIERGFIFLWTMTLGAGMLGGIGYFIDSLAIGGDGIIGAIVGVMLALLLAITMMGNVSRYRA